MHKIMQKVKYSTVLANILHTCVVIKVSGMLKLLTL